MESSLINKIKNAFLKECENKGIKFTKRKDKNFDPIIFNVIIERNFLCLCGIKHYINISDAKFKKMIVQYYMVGKNSNCQLEDLYSNIFKEEVILGEKEKNFSDFLQSFAKKNELTICCSFCKGKEDNKNFFIKKCHD